MALSDALPRLRAEEALDHAARVALGSGALRPENAQELQRVWRAQSEGDLRARRPLSTPAEQRAFARLLGLQVVDEPKAPR